MLPVYLPNLSVDQSFHNWNKWSTPSGGSVVHPNNPYYTNVGSGGVFRLEEYFYPWSELLMSYFNTYPSEILETSDNGTWNSFFYTLANLPNNTLQFVESVTGDYTTFEQEHKLFLPFTAGIKLDRYVEGTGYTDTYDIDTIHISKLSYTASNYFHWQDGNFFGGESGDNPTGGVFTHLVFTSNGSPSGFFPPNGWEGHNNPAYDNFDSWTLWIPNIIDETGLTPPAVTITGCMDPEASNYNPDATEDDGSCEYIANPEDEVEDEVEDKIVTLTPIQNNWDKILTTLQSHFSNELTMLNVYIGDNIKIGSQYLRLEPSSSEIQEYTQGSESREYTINIFLYHQPNINNKLYQMLNLVSLVEDVIKRKPVMILSDDTKLYNCRIDSTDLGTNIESNMNIVSFIFKADYTQIYNN